MVFSDEKLEKQVRVELGKANGPLTKADLAMLETLNANDREIESLSGLEYAVNLSSLSLYNNQISDVSPLASLTKLENLSLHNK